MKYFETREKLLNKEIKLTDLVEDLLKKIGSDEYNVFNSLNPNLLGQAEELQKAFDETGEAGPLFGAIVAVKDNIMVKGMNTTASSKMLENYMANYDASIIERIEKAGALIIGKTNMDEFAMGTSSETSYFGPTLNPLGKDLVPGGSSSGAAVAQKLGYCHYSFGTDTGGSVRQPAANCSVIGYTPSYGVLSRYGVISMANTLDVVGLFGETPEEMAYFLEVFAGFDEKDQTSIREKIDFKFQGLKDIKGLKIGYFDPDDVYGIQDEVKADYSKGIQVLKDMGADLEVFDLKYKRYLSPTYSVVSTSEVSSNLSRFDGIRYGYQTEDYEDIDELYTKTRSEGFGEEAQRRIAIGFYYLGESFERNLYQKALVARKLIKNEMEELLNKYDLIITPSTITLASKFGERGDSVADFKSGDFHVMTNLTGLCAISIPMQEGLGGSVQLVGQRFDDRLLLEIANLFVKELR